MTTVLRREEFLSNLGFARQRADDTCCTPLMENVVSLESWFNRGGNMGQMYSSSMILEDAIEVIYLRMMTRALSDDPNTALEVEDEN